ncbi:MAG: TIGR02444 family protein, partial [Pseudomonadota bacterium]
ARQCTSSGSTSPAFPCSTKWLRSDSGVASRLISMIVAPACLALQERHGFDVNFLLFCLWLGRDGPGAVDGQTIARLHETVAVWHTDIVRRLRAIRRRLKEDLGPVDGGLAQGLRRRIQKIEIDAEHIEQLALGTALGKLPLRAAGAETGPAAAAANVGAYFGLLGAAPGNDDRRELAIILAAGFPDRAEEEIRKHCAAVG